MKFNGEDATREDLIFALKVLKNECLICNAELHNKEDGCHACRIGSAICCDGRVMDIPLRWEPTDVEE